MEKENLGQQGYYMEHCWHQELDSDGDSLQDAGTVTISGLC